MSQQAAESWLHACSSEELRCTKVDIVMLGFNGWGWQAHLTLTVNCTVPSCLLIPQAFRISVGELCSMDISPHHLFSDTSFGSQNIHLVRIQLSLDSKIWELRSLWVSAVYVWVGVAGHLAESLSRISLLRFLLLSVHSSFDRARTCRIYCMIWKHWSKHTT
jgi:hypothetical protein